MRYIKMDINLTLGFVTGAMMVGYLWYALDKTILPPQPTQREMFIDMKVREYVDSKIRGHGYDYDGLMGVERDLAYYGIVFNSYM